MRNERSRPALRFFCLVCFWLAVGSSSAHAEEQGETLSQMSTEELVSLALQSSIELKTRLLQRSADLRESKAEIECLQADLEKMRQTLEARANEPATSAEELECAQKALMAISSLLGDSKLTWQNSIDAVDKALSQAARKQKRAEIVAVGTTVTTIVALIWALVEHFCGG